MKLKARLKKWRKNFRSFVDQRFYGFSPLDLSKCLHDCGVSKGDCLLVHSSYNQFGGFHGQTIDVLRTLESAVGESGTVAMPTIPFSGSSEAYVKSQPVFDVLRTPSRVGLLTELFRRQDHVKRSLHPTHPVAVCGPLADVLIADHAQASHPCGEHSPWSKFERYDAKIVFLGAPFASMTYVHAFDDMPGLPTELPIFAPQKYRIECRDAHGAQVMVETMITNAALGRIRDLSVLRNFLDVSGDLTKQRLGKLDVVVVETAAVARAIKELSSRGISHYRPKG